MRAKDRWSGRSDLGVHVTSQLPSPGWPNTLPSSSSPYLCFFSLSPISPHQTLALVPQFPSSLLCFRFASSAIYSAPVSKPRCFLWSCLRPFLFQRFSSGQTNSSKLQIRGLRSRPGSCWTCRIPRSRPLLVRIRDSRFEFVFVDACWEVFCVSASCYLERFCARFWRGSVVVWIAVIGVSEEPQVPLSVACSVPCGLKRLLMLASMFFVA